MEAPPASLDLFSAHEQLPFHLEDDQNPFGSNGLFTQIGEHIPLVNQGIQELHKHRGDEEAYKRALNRNPVGANGVVTQACEHIPLVCDGIEALHRINGEQMAAERASARTLTRLLSKDGAVTKVAELIPGTNIVAAMMHEINGNHEEAVRALSIFDNWTQVGEPDGPLAKVAELFPGMDVAAFALHVTNQQYPQALRSITKTQWVNFNVKTVTIFIVSTTSVMETEVSHSEIDGVNVEPTGLSMILGINDIMLKFFEFDQFGNVRPKTQRDGSPSNHRRRSKSGQEAEFFGVETEEQLSDFVNGTLKYVLSSIKRDFPDYVKWSMECMNEHTFLRWRTNQLRYRILLKPTMPEPGPEFSQALQKAFSRATLRHAPLPAATPRMLLPPLIIDRRKSACKAAAAVGCLSATAIAGAKVGTVACLAGLMASAAACGRWALRQIHTNFNSLNVEMWEGGALGIDTERPGWTPGVENGQTHGAVVELDPDDADDLVQRVRDHVVRHIRGGCLAAPLLRFLMPGLKAMFKHWGRDWEVLPFVMDIETGDLEIETPTWPEGLKLPSLRVGVVCDLNVWGTGPSRVRIIMHDKLQDQFAQQAKEQIEKLDLRTFDPRLTGFTRPLRLEFDMAVRWHMVNEATLELTNLRTHLHLPE